MTHPTNTPTPGEPLTAESVKLCEALNRILPITVRETPGYAELTFGESQTQAMTLEPDTWLALNALAPTAAKPVEDGAPSKGEEGREAIWKVVHEVWQLLDDAETDSAGITTPDQERWRAVSEAMDALESLVPDSEGPFWGGYPVNYFWGLK